MRNYGWSELKKLLTEMVHKSRGPAPAQHLAPSINSSAVDPVDVAFYHILAI